MAYNLQIAERANEQIDKLTGYLINRLQNRDAAIHFLNGLDVVYRRLEENPYQFSRKSGCIFAAPRIPGSIFDYDALSDCISCRWADGICSWRISYAGKLYSEGRRFYIGQ